MTIGKPARPCDCIRCDCGNVGDAQAVAIWDAENPTRAPRIEAIIPALVSHGASMKNQAKFLTVNEPTERADDAIYVHDEDDNDIATFFHDEHATVGQSYETALRLANLLVEANNGASQ